MFQSISCFYYPTKVVLVDDNEYFLNELPNNLTNSFSYETYLDPAKALDYIVSNADKYLMPEHYFGEYEDIITGVTINVDLHKIRSLIYNKDKYKLPSVVIVDHDMPGISGIDFCEKLKKYPIKVIMLTGVAKEREAIDAFNRGIIDKFIFKSQKDVFEQLDHSINELNMQYFKSVSDYIINNISNSTASFLNSINFNRFLLQLMIKKNIVEYYLVDPDGSFLLLNNEGKLLWLVVQTPNKAETIINIAKDLGADLEVINALEDKSKICAFFSDNDFNRSIHDWNKMLVNAKFEDNIYYSLIEGDKVCELTGLKSSEIFYISK